MGLSYPKFFHGKLRTGIYYGKRVLWCGRCPTPRAANWREGAVGGGGGDIQHSEDRWGRMEGMGFSNGPKGP